MKPKNQPVVPEAQRKAFRFGCNTDVFPPEEIEALMKQGARFEALAAKEVPAITIEEEHFLQVDREESEPSNVAERGWARLKGRREFERDQQSASPSQPPEDYGIIEWDKEKCWW